MEAGWRTTRPGARLSTSGRAPALRGVARFIANGIRDQHALKQLTEQVSVAGEDEIMERSRVGDGQHAGSEAGPVLQRPTPQVGAGAEPGGEVVGDGNGHVHGGMVAQPRRGASRA